MKKRYQKVHIEISNICNLQCSFCPEVLRAKKLMGLDEFENIVKQVAPLAEQIAFHLMGDPLVHPHLDQLIEICHRHQAPVFLVTNGVLLKEKQAQILLHPGFRQVNFSLHSFGDNYPDRDPTKYLEAIFAYTQAALKDRPELYINYRLWNLQDPKGALATNTQILGQIRDRFDWHQELPTDVRRGKSVRITGRLYLHFDTEFIWPDLELPVLGTRGTCYGLKSHFGVLVDGTVVPCCLDKEGQIPLGNILEQNLDSILDSKRSRDIVLGFQRHELIEPLCQRCQYVERFQGKLRKDQQAGEGLQV